MGGAAERVGSIVRGSVRRMPRDESENMHDRARVASDNANMGAASTLPTLEKIGILWLPGE